MLGHQITLTVDGEQEQLTVKGRGDVHASSKYRVNVLPIDVERAILSAADDAKIDREDDAAAPTDSPAGSRTNSQEGELR
ncbi:hypothetical protein [Natronorubrum texcoconense]|uniref:Uncharacterized protein n=1 Tax=Natronorubrum texcoconense TaxID=1095776 RepID=A0A1G9DCZ5_9EURY|nr:hypothetical protein [Natronorubrum texcoconense]SDK61667.1 hypothetical protein SAMN04515672_3525 [Natronorubrum texcoconense]